MTSGKTYLRALFVVMERSFIGVIRPLIGSLTAMKVEVRLIEWNTISRNKKELEKELVGYPSEVVVTFDPDVLRKMLELRDNGLIRAPVISVLTELVPQKRWALAEADRYIIPDEESAVLLEECGVSQEKILVSGFVLPNEFARSKLLSRREAKKKLKLASETIALVYSEGLAESSLQQIAMELSSGDELSCILFDTGGSDELALRLHRYTLRLDMKVQCFGQIEDESLLWRSADVIFARPFWRIASRAVAFSSRMVSLLPHGERQQATADALEERLVGVTSKNIKGMSSVLYKVLQLPEKTDGLRLNQGTKVTSEIIISVASDRLGILEESRLYGDK